MSKKKIDDQEMDVADYFDRFANWTEKNAKNIILGFLVFTLGVVGFWGFSAVKSRALNTAAHETGVVNRRIDLLERAVADVKDKESAEFQTKKDEEIKSIHTDALNAVSNNSSRSVADFTAVRWASYLIGEDKKDMALEILDKTEPSPDRELSASNLFLKASILSGSSKADEALKIYDRVLSQEGWSVFHPVALIHKGTLLESKGDLEGAMALFDKAQNMIDADKAGFSKDAAKYKRLLKLKKNNPQLFEKKSS